MNEQKFRSEMNKAKTMQENCDDPFRAEYWVGYMRGLRRAYHGEKFGTDSEHLLWLRSADDSDERQKQRGLGYRDGILCGEISSKMGRPKRIEKSVVLAPITVSEEIKNGLESLAEMAGVKMPELRRKIYQGFIDSH